MANIKDFKQIQILPPFKCLCMTIGNLPTTYLESMTYYEMLQWFCKYLEDTIIPTINNNGEAVSELQKNVSDFEINIIELFNTLKNYVDNYFKNLDVQEEINNKLDEMAESGELENILLHYVNTSRIYNTTIEMLEDYQNIVKNQKIKTLGYYEINDGGGAEYFITDTIQENSHYETLENNLYANLILNDVINVKQFGAKGDGETNDTSAISKAIQIAKNNQTIVFPTAIYKCNIYSNKPLNFDFMNSTLISNTNENILRIYGSMSNKGYIITENLSRGDKQITLHNNGDINLQANDYILLRDDTTRPNDGLTNINEEVHQIESIENNVITLKDFVRSKKSVATLTANVYKINMLDTINIKNVNIYDDNNDSVGIHVLYSKNINIENIQAKNMNSPAIAIVSSVNININNFDIDTPQSAIAGKGYGILLDHGTNSFSITNGKGKKQRHLIDCSSCFDGIIKNVIANNSQASSFMLAHNSFSSDLTFDKCVSNGGDWYGFVYGSQGVNNYYDMTAYNFNILNCEVYPDNLSNNSIGCFFQCPVVDSLIDNLIVKGKKTSYGYGIRLQPINNRLIIKNTKIYNSLIAFYQDNQAVQENDNIYFVKNINSYIENCNFAFRFSNVKEIFIDKCYTDNCNTFIQFAVYSKEKINPIRFLNITNCIFKTLVNLFTFNNANTKNYMTSDNYIIGKINNINLYTSQGNYKRICTNNAQILNDYTSLYARCSSPERYNCSNYFKC